MSFLNILIYYILPPLLSLIGAFFGVLFGSAITIKFFERKTIKKPANATYNNRLNVGGKK